MKRFFLRNPWVRTLIPLLLMGIASVSGNTLVVEISQGDRVFWSAILFKGSFYVLLISTLILGLYQVLIF